MKSGKSPQVSIVIPTRDGGDRFKRLLTALVEQRESVSYELVVVDSSSTDGTDTAAQDFGARVFSILPEQFSHSRTRNFGAAQSVSSEYILFLNQDAIPANEQWLGCMVAAMQRFPEVCALSCAEIAPRAADWVLQGVSSFLAKGRYLKGTGIIEPYTVAKNYLQAPGELRNYFLFTSVCAIFQREYFLLHPFNEKVHWGEDLVWAVENNSRGATLGLTFDTAVMHDYQNLSESELQYRARQMQILETELFSW